MGHTVNFRSHKQSYKDKNPVMNPKEDSLIFENTHEAIVKKTFFQSVYIANEKSITRFLP